MLEVYKRGQIWWAKGRAEYNGRPISHYIRASTGALTEAGARDWIKETEAREIRRYLLGDEADQLTFSEAVILYPAKPSMANMLIRILEAKPDLKDKPANQFSGTFIRNLARELRPMVATDTMWREVVTPIRAVINNAHDLGKCNHIRVKPFSEAERIDQDNLRGKQSRVERRPSDRDWIEKFCAHADVYNAALVRFMFETAARIDQAISLRPGDLDLVNSQVWLKAAKGHPAQWVKISPAMRVELANLPPKRPHCRKLGYKMEPRVFGYGSSTGYTGAWKTICKRGGIEYISAHPAGRHGFYTELRVRMGVDPVNAAKAGRWKDVALPDQIYAHAEIDQAEIREQIRTGRVQLVSESAAKSLKSK